MSLIHEGGCDCEQCKMVNVNACLAENDNFEIPDDVIFECQDAAAQERARWAIFEQPRGEVMCVRNREAPIDVQRRAEALKHGNAELGTIEVIRMIFQNTEDAPAKHYAKLYVDWMGHRAALKHYEQFRAAQKPIILGITR